MKNKTYKSNFKEAKARISAAENRALEAIGMFIDGEATNRMPVGQYPSGTGLTGGNLRSRSSYKVYPELKKVTIGNSAKYAVYVEEGTGIYYPGGKSKPWVYKIAPGVYRWTKGQKGKHMYRDAAMQNLNEIGEIAKKELKKI